MIISYKKEKEKNSNENTISSYLAKEVDEKITNCR